MIIYQHDSARLHHVPTGHPERPERIDAVNACLAQDFGHLTYRQAPRATKQTVALIHNDEYIEALFDAAPEHGLRGIDGDTYLSPNTLDAAMRGVGAACAAVDDVMRGEADTAFVAMRPPGHHAEPDRAMGFCFFASAAIAARHAQDTYGIDNVAVLDFDVHHGNGTQASLIGKAHCYYASTHEMPLFPGTGQVSDDKTILNQPMQAGMAGKDMLDAWQPLLSDLAKIGPELIILSAGFDAHQDDPLANLQLQSSDFYELTSRIMSLAQTSANGRVVSLLEGGYDLSALGSSVSYHLQALEGRVVRDDTY